MPVFCGFWEGDMPVCERNFRGLPVDGQNTINLHRPGAAVIAFRPVGATEAGPSSSWHAGRTRGADRSGAAVVIPFRSRFSLPVKSVLPKSQSAAKSAEGADQKSMTGEEEYRQQMFENLLAAAWVGTLMSAGYYMLNVLAAPSMLP
jgi:hypothetical protein